jgi:NIPSNAP
MPAQSGGARSAIEGLRGRFPIGTLEHMAKTNMVKKLLPLAFLMASAAFAQNAVYELRTYTAVDGKMDALVARFRDHTIRIFNKHGMESVAYFTPEDKKNTLVYILKHPSRELGEKHWTEFQNDPEWKKVAAESEANGKIVDKVERVWLDPTEFSKLK